jgi:hypothetical protein
MASPIQSIQSKEEPAPERGPRSLFRVGVVAAASALAGGLAMAWFYRKTLARLRQAEVPAASDAEKSGECEGI